MVGWETKGTLPILRSEVSIWLSHLFNALPTPPASCHSNRGPWSLLEGSGLADFFCLHSLLRLKYMMQMAKSDGFALDEFWLQLDQPNASQAFWTQTMKSHKTWIGQATSWQASSSNVCCSPSGVALTRRVEHGRTMRSRGNPEANYQNVLLEAHTRSMQGAGTREGHPSCTCSALGDLRLFKYKGCIPSIGKCHQALLNGTCSSSFTFDCDGKIRPKQLILHSYPFGCPFCLPRAGHVVARQLLMSHRIPTPRNCGGGGSS